MTDQSTYRKLCKSEPSIPLFSQDWWLDSVCGKTNWDVALVERGGEVIASNPYYMTKHLGLNIIKMPLLTQTMGPWISTKTSNRISNQIRILTELIDALPPCDAFYQNFHYSINNWLPYYWKGFEQTTRYTYIIPDMSEISKVFDKFDRKSVKWHISKCQDHLDISASEDIRTFYDINSYVYKKQGLTTPYSFSYIQRMDAICCEKGRRRMLFAKDSEGNIHAAIYMIWDDNTAYLLMTGINPMFQSSGASKLLVWEAIKYASTVTKQFDFAGSMLEPIERDNRSFGAIQIPYSSISKINSFRLKLLNAFQKII